MADYDYSKSGLGEAAKNPALPAGGSQAAAAGANQPAPGAYDYDLSGLGVAAAEGGLSGAQSQYSWLTGFNADGTNNGWETTFWNDAVKQTEELWEKGGIAEQFARDDATGVVTYDHTIAGKDYKFGDVYNKGKYEGNLYDIFSNDRVSADMLMMDMTLWGEEGAAKKQEIFSDSDIEGRAKREMEDVRERNSADMQSYLQAQDFNKGVDEKAERWSDSGNVTLGITLTGGLGGGGIGAGIGSLFPGAGTAIGGVLGGGAGAWGAYSNRDKIIEDMARASEISEMAFRENSTGAALMTTAAEWSKVSMNFMSPLQNVVQGAEELRQDGWEGIGDGEAAWYDVDDKTGESKTPLAMKLLNFGASIGDSFGMMASAPARLIYQGQMGVSIAGSVGELALTGGESFRDAEGGFDNVFTSQDGKADWLGGLSAIGAIGIDAAQLGSVGALASKAGLHRTADDAGEAFEYGAHRFTRNRETGEITVQSQKTALLAPSEQASWVNLRWAARQEARRRPGSNVVTNDDLYRVAMRYAAGERRMKMAVVSGIGEGYEEGAQYVLETRANEGHFNKDDFFGSVSAGFAMGFGMYHGIMGGGRTGDDYERAQARQLAHIESDGAMTDDQFNAMWNGLTKTERRIYAARGQADAEVQQAAFRKANQEAAAEFVASEVDAAYALDARRSISEKELEKAGGMRTDAYRVMSIRTKVGEVSEHGQLLDDAIPVDAISQSLLSSVEALRDRLRGIENQTKQLPLEIERALAKDSLTADDKARIEGNLRERLRQAQAMRAVGQVIVSNILRRSDEVYAGATEERTGEIVRDVNKFLTMAWDRQLLLEVAPELNIEEQPFTADELKLAAAQFVTAMHSREPKLDSGSYVALRFHVDIDDTLTRSDNYVRVSPEILQSINGDFDGDKLRAENQLVWSTAEYARMRAGANLSGAGDGIDIAAYSFEGALVNMLADSLGHNVEAGQSLLAHEANGVLDKIGFALEAGLGDAVTPASLREAMEAFRSALLARDPEARTVLLNRLYQSSAAQIEALGTETWSNKWYWISQTVRANMQSYQRYYARRRAAYDRMPSKVGDTPRTVTPAGRDLAKREAAAMGQSLAIFAPGDSLFRAFQQIHFTVEESPVLEAARVDRADTQFMAALYRELSQDITQTELQRVMHPDPVARRALAMLARLVDSGIADGAIYDPAGAMTVLGSLVVQDVVELADGTLGLDPQKTTLMQLLLKRALEADKYVNRNIVGRNEKLRSRHAKIDSMTRAGKANAATIEVLGDIPFGDLFAGNTGNLPSHLTPNQWLANYAALAPEDRLREVTLLTESPLYLDGRLKKDPPYTLEEAANGHLSAFRVIVNAMVEQGNALLYLDSDGNVRGTYADQSKTSEKDFVSTHGEIRAMLRDFLAVNRKTEIDGVRIVDMTPAQQIQKMLEANPAVGRSLLATIPQADANAIYDFRNDQLYVANWVYESLAEDDAQLAHMIFFRNMLLNVKFNAAVQRMNEDGASINKVESRLAQLLYVHARAANKTLFNRIIRELESSTRVSDFMHFVNNHPGVRGQQAPFVAYVDDAATFNPLFSGGWVTATASSELRQALSSLREVAQEARKSMKAQKRIMERDHLTVEALRNAAGIGSREADRDDMASYEQFLLAIERAKKTPRGFGPSAMLALVRGAARMFDAHAHDKGQVMTPFEPMGQFQALMDAFGFMPGLEKQMSAATSWDVDDVKANLGSLINGVTEMMDADGSTVVFDPDPVKIIEMLSNPATAPLAKSILYPSVLDLTPMGTLSERYLSEMSLQEFLGEVVNPELYARDADQNIDLDTALRYVSRLDSISNGKGGDFEGLRGVIDLVIARTTALTRSATEQDYDRLTKEAFLDVADALQISGHMLAAGNGTTPGGLLDLQTEAIKELRANRAALSLPMVSENGRVIPELVDLLVMEAETEREEFQTASDEAIDQTTEEGRNRRNAAEERIDAHFDRQIQRIKALASDDRVELVKAEFTFNGDATHDIEVQNRLVDYVMGSANYQARAGSVAPIVQKITQLRLTKAPLDSITSDEWGSLSRAMISLRVVNDIYAQADHISIMGYPKGQSKPDDPVVLAERQQLFDPDMAYIPRRLLSPTSHLAEAAMQLHMDSRQDPMPLDKDKALNRLRRGILNPKKTGVWTEGVYRQTLEAHQRIDSASSAPGVAASGNRPKTLATMAFATRRDGSVPPPADLLSTVQVNGRTLLAEHVGSGADHFNSPYQVLDLIAGPNLGQGIMLGQLSGRFYKSIRINGNEISLSRVGIPWHREAPSFTGYASVSLTRLRKLIQAEAKKLGMDASQLTVELDFFHPEDAPAGDFNNVYFEGTSFTYANDDSPSLIASLFSANGGRTSGDTQIALDANKKGMAAWRRIQTILRQDLSSAESLAATNFQAMLWDKTRRIMEASNGGAPLEIEYINAIYKMLKLHHVMAGTNPETGEQEIWSAEQIIQHQKPGPDGVVATLPAYLKLRKLSPRVLRTLLGDTGSQSVARFFTEDSDINPELTPTYKGITPRMVELFGRGLAADPVDIAQTSLVNVGRQQVLSTRFMMTDAEADSYRERLITLNREADDAHQERVQVRGVDFSKNYENAIRMAKLAVEDDAIARNFNSDGIGRFVGTKDRSAVNTAQGMLNDQRSTPNDQRAGWILSRDGKASTAGGLLTLDTLFNERESAAFNIVAGDVVFVDLSSFEDWNLSPVQEEAAIQKALRYLAGRGATIVLASDGRRDMRNKWSFELRRLQYDFKEGSPYILEPRVYSSRLQNIAAYESTLFETRKITPAGHSIRFLSYDSLGITENAMMHNPRSTRHRSRKLLGNMIPTSNYPSYNTLDSIRDRELFRQAQRQIATATDPAERTHRKTLLEMGGRDAGRVMGLEEALDRLHERASQGNELFFKPGDEIKRGDIIPLVHPDGSIIFYRHGFEMPKPGEVKALQAKSGVNIALAKSKTEPSATANDGVIREITSAARFGRRLVLEVELQVHGNKVSDRSGMKYTTVPLDDGILPEGQSLFAGNSREIDDVMDQASQMSKESWLGWVNNYRNAFAFFRVDFLPDMTEFFFPGQDRNDRGLQDLTYNILLSLQKDPSLKLSVDDAQILKRASAVAADALAPFAEALTARQEIVDAGFNTNWRADLMESQTATGQIAQAMVLYLMTDGADVNNVIQSGGFSSPDVESEYHRSREMPAMFTDLLDNGLDAPVHAELIDRFNDQLNNSGAGSYVLHNDWTFEITAPDVDGKLTTRRGLLQYAEDRGTGDNPVTDGQAYDINEKASVSPHNVLAAAMSTNAFTVHKPLKKSEAFLKGFSREGALTKGELGPEATGGSMWTMLTQATLGEPVAVPWLGISEAEVEWRDEARAEVVGYYHPLNRKDWSPKTKGGKKAKSAEEKEFNRLALEIINTLNLHPQQVTFVETWVRQRLGRPYGMSPDGTKEFGVISVGDAIEVAKEIRARVNRGDLPVSGGNVGLTDVNHLTEIFAANRGRVGGWTPHELSTESSFEDWVSFSLGSAFRDDMKFDSMYLLSVDGFFHQYQNATVATRYLPASTSPAMLQKLLVPQMQQMDIEGSSGARASVSGSQDFLLKEPTLFAASDATVFDIGSKHRLYSDGVEPDPQSAMGKQKRRIQRWRTADDISKDKGSTYASVTGRGRTYVDDCTEAHHIWRAIINIRIGNAMFNPALIAWAPVEGAWRNSIHELATTLSGESTGRVGLAKAKLGERLRENATIESIAEKLGMQAAYTTDELVLAQRIVPDLASRSDFTSMVYKELTYNYPLETALGKFGRAAEWYAKAGARLQDPAWGIIPRRLATLYVETAMRHITQSRIGESVYSVRTLLEQLNRDPHWLSKNDPQAHQMAMNTIAQVRSVKATPLAKGIRAIYEPLSANHNVAINNIGNFLKMTAIFSNYWGNFATTITGAQAASDLVARWLDGSEMKWSRRLDRALRGRDLIPENEARYHDMSDVLESIDFADAIIQSGVSHTMLFVAWMGLGAALSGEDEEDKWRRYAEQQGVHVMADPRELEADFRGRDVVYLDWLPLGIDSFFKDKDDPNGRASIQLGWVIKPYIAPLIGFERFSKTGDFSHVIDGFREAVGSNPLTNSMLWDVAESTSAELAANAFKNFESDDPQEQMQGPGKLMQAVAVLEGYLLENQFLNSIYVGADRYDRDPYSMVELDSDETIQTDAKGQPTKTSALQTYKDIKTGKISQSYLKRDEWGANLHSLTESRFGLATLTSLVPGVFSDGGWLWESSTFRYNMAPKEVKIKREPTSQEEAEAYILAAYKAYGAVHEGAVVAPSLSADDFVKLIIAENKAAGVFVDSEIIAKQAEVLAAQQPPALLSMVNEAGEHLTDRGAKAVFLSLYNGKYKLDDAALDGVYVPEEMRDRIFDEWMKEIVQEGVDMQLDPIAAKSRAKRIMFGYDAGPGAVSLFDIIYDQGISYNQTLRFNQLNTTYAQGPNGKMYATGYNRRSLVSMFGIGNKAWTSESAGVEMDSRLNTVLTQHKMNTGLRAIELKDESWDVPNEKDLAEKLDAIERKLDNLNVEPSSPYEKKSGSGGYGGYGGYRRGGGGGGYSGGGGYPNFSKMYSLPFGTTAYGNSIPFINTSNPIIRRADVRRERVWSERGRLKQWQ